MKTFAAVLSIARALGALPLAAGEDMTTGKPAKPILIDVYKSKSCHCCVDWMKHLESNGIAARAVHPKDLDAVKASHGVTEQYESCHTGVTSDGYVFEGHVPAKFIRQFLASPPPDAIGLAVPGMPLGSPGMESDDFFMPYKIMLLKKDGTAEVYANMTKISEQFEEKAAAP